MHSVCFFVRYMFVLFSVCVFFYSFFRSFVFVFVCSVLVCWRALVFCWRCRGLKQLLNCENLDRKHSKITQFKTKALGEQATCYNRWTGLVLCWNVCYCVPTAEVHYLLIKYTCKTPVILTWQSYKYWRSNLYYLSVRASVYIVYSINDYICTKNIWCYSSNTYTCIFVL